MSCARHSSVFASCDACQAPFRREAEQNATIADLRAKLAAAEKEIERAEKARTRPSKEMHDIVNRCVRERDEAQWATKQSDQRAEAAEAEAGRLREALEPFAAFADILPDIGCGSWADGERIIDARGHPARLTVGHCRAARAALARPGGGGG